MPALVPSATATAMTQDKVTASQRRQPRRARNSFEQRAPRLRFADLILESVDSIGSKPLRSALTSVGTIIGVCALVSVSSIALSAGAQINDQFDRLRATQVTATASDPNDFAAFPADTDARLGRLSGVVAGGFAWRVTAAPPPKGGPRASEALAPVVAASPGFVSAADVRLQQGRAFDAFHDRSHSRVALIGKAAARQLGITSLAGSPAVFLGDQGWTVIGIIDSTERSPELLLDVVVPSGSALAAWGQPGPGSDPHILAETVAGAAPQVAQQLALSLRPDAPEAIRVVPPPDPQTLRRSVSNDFTAMLAGLAAICLFVGGVGIANTSLVSVIERTPELGLRRALGARPKHVAYQVWAEATLIGTLGSVVGTALGIVVVVVVCLSQQWTPIVSPQLLIVAPVLGVVTGLLAGLYPAVRAAKVEPASALKR